MSTYQIGSLCEDCQRHGMQNYLKSFYINLDEQIIKCESNSCMFPYLRKPTTFDSTNSKPSESTAFLDEFIQQSLKEIDDSPAKTSAQKCTAKLELDTSDLFDFSAIFMAQPIKTEVKEKSLTFQNVKQETNAQPVVLESKVMNNNVKSKTNATVNLKNQMQPPQISRISRCLSDVKSSSKYANIKKTKTLGEKIEPVLVIEPQSGKSMRPLDLIKRYVKNK